MSYTIYHDNEEYGVRFYTDSEGFSPVFEYIDSLNTKEKAKVLKYIEFLRSRKGVLDEPYAKHVKDKLRELRVDFARNRHRIFYFTFTGKTIILLHAFLKKTAKTPSNEIMRAEDCYYNVIRNQKFYE